ncbi:hypothetical protein GCM10028777_13060 [Angustibacter speluncae]
MSADSTGRYASLLRFGLYAHAAAVELGRDPRVLSLARLKDEAGRPLGTVTCQDGSSRPFDLQYALELVTTEPTLRGEMDRAWCVSSLVLLGDRLAAEGYYDRAPVLEMVRHLRNGIAHGNRFTLRNPSELERWPAHTRDAACQSSDTFEVTPALDGTQVLFGFMRPGDVLDLLISVSTHLRDYSET